METANVMLRLDSQTVLPKRGVTPAQALAWVMENPSYAPEEILLKVEITGEITRTGREEAERLREKVQLLRPGAQEIVEKICGSELGHAIPQTFADAGFTNMAIAVEEVAAPEPDGDPAEEAGEPDTHQAAPAPKPPKKGARRRSSPE